MTVLELLWHESCVQFLQLTAVIALVFIVNCLWGRSRPHLAYVLLLLVVVKALTPPLFASRFGVFSNLRQIATVRSLSSDSALVPEESLLSSNLDPLVTNEIPSSGMMRTEPPPSATTESRRMWTLGNVAVLTWIAGACIALVTAAFAYRQRRIFAIREGSQPDLKTENAFRDLKERLGIRLPTRLMMGPESMGPCCFGFLVPTVLLPSSVPNNATERQLEMILAHELVHVRRHDTRVSLIQLLAVCIWWFNPLMWLVSRRLSNERERCCDDEVRATLDCSPAEYAQAILDFSRTPKLGIIPSPATGAGGFRTTKRRLEDIMKRKTRLHSNTPKWHYLLLAAGCLIVAPGAPIRVNAQARPQKAINEAALDPQQLLYADAKTLPQAIELLRDYLDEHAASEYRQLISEESVKAGIKNTLTATTTRTRIQLANAKEPERKMKIQSRLAYLTEHVEPTCKEVTAGNWPKNVYFYCMTPKPKFSTLTVNLVIDHRNTDLGDYKIGGDKPTAYGINVITLNYGLEPRIDGPITGKVIVD